MAVTISAEDLQQTLGASKGALQADQLQALTKRFLSYASVLIETVAPNAPEAAQNEAVIRLLGYEIDRRNSSLAILASQSVLPASVQGALANSFRYSGAQAVLLPWTQHGAGIVGEEDET